MSYGSPGAGGQGHFAGEFFKSRAKVDFLHVPYRGTGPALQDVMAGVVDCIFDGTSKPLIDAGKVKALALTSAARSAMYPGVPTMDESGLKGLDMTTWIGLTAPSGTPADVVRKLTDALRVALKDKQVADASLATGTTVVPDTSPDDLRRRIEHDVAMYGQIAKEANIQPQ
jgi:tripartite-type tricarboxylate transporter receptor subunit TctC